MIHFTTITELTCKCVHTSRSSESWISMTESRGTFPFMWDCSYGATHDTRPYQLFGQHIGLGNPVPSLRTAAAVAREKTGRESKSSRIERGVETDWLSSSIHIQYECERLTTEPTRASEWQTEQKNSTKIRGWKSFFSSSSDDFTNNRLQTENETERKNVDLKRGEEITLLRIDGYNRHTFIKTYFTANFQPYKRRVRPFFSGRFIK